MSGTVACWYAQVDVFTATPFAGNPVAVVFDADGLDTSTMQRIARWTNLSETVFVLSPTTTAADYRVRIFGMLDEFPFAGHPTLGTAHAVRARGLVSPDAEVLRMECQAGIVDVCVEGANRYAFRLPRYATREATAGASIAGALGLSAIIGTPAMIDTGPQWLVAQVPSVEPIVVQADALRSIVAANHASGITVYANAHSGIAVRTFYFAPQLIEDPICGSGNAAVAVHRLQQGAIRDGTTYVALQGQQIGRDGAVTLRIEKDRIHVGGECITCITGTIALPA